MEVINVKVVDCNGNVIINEIVLYTQYVNYIYNKLYKYFFHCHIKLLYNGRKISPLEKICDIIDIIDINITFNVVTYEKLKYSYPNVNLHLVVNNKEQIIDFVSKYSCDSSYYHKINCFKAYLNTNHNCLNIINICCNKIYTAILFEDGIALIFSNTTEIIKRFNNVTKIVKTICAIGIIINNNKLITMIQDKIFDNDDLCNLDYKNVYANTYFMFIIGHTSITIVHHIASYNNAKLQLINKYEINNVSEIYDNCGSSLLAIILNNSQLMTFEISSLWAEAPLTKLNIIPITNINEQSLKIRKILCISFSFVVLTWDDIVFIWGNNKNLIELFELLKNKLYDVEDIVVTHECIGILKKNNSIIILSLKGIYSIYESIKNILNYKYIKIISTNFQIFILADNNNVYEIIKPKEDNNYYYLDIDINIVILNDIKELYSNNTEILAISNDKIVYALVKSMIYYKKQILDLKNVGVYQNTFIIIKSNYDLIEINRHYEKTLNNITKFIKI